MISPTLLAIETDLRRAAGERAYVEIQRLIPALCSQAAVEIRALPPGAPQASEIALWVDTLLEWTNVMLRTCRAAQAEELRRIPFVTTYLRAQSW